MNALKTTVLAFLAATFIGLSATAQTAKAADSVSITGASGYDLVSYHQSGGPVSGNGHNVVVHDGVTYLFASADNKKAFQADPARYLPAYGGYCAFGVSKGKKFVSDPTVWKVVDGTLYLNLDKKVQSIWNKDIPGNINDADDNWKTIATVSPSDL